MKVIIFLCGAIFLAGCAAGPRSVPALIKALRHSEPETRALAAQELGEKGADADPALPALFQAFRDRHASVYRAVSDALVKLGEPSRSGLMDLAATPLAWLRCRAVETLGRLPPSSSSTPLLFKAMEDHDTCVHGGIL